ncbi:C-type natriuretic peptide [Tupaia chinensis]|uniref:C-type natriuretic peptide n=1 Tax=Tupaia chinensis TaxID=246437 RepID=L8Y082_TUPCH|nr:C-type natriuretic peptide [Tupaia chinensis]ELV09587.1 C-type natriuretic peptide [Tupaia chinensis]
MHLSQLLACALLLMLLSLRPSEAKPGAPPKVGAVAGTPGLGRARPGEELAEPQAAGGGQKKGDKTPGGGGANLKGDRSRLPRDLRVDTKSRAAWARLLHEHPNARKYKGSNKKGLSKGCFGLKLDRIGSMSGLGC